MFRQDLRVHERFLEVFGEENTSTLSWIGQEHQKNTQSSSYEQNSVLGPGIDACSHDFVCVGSSWMGRRDLQEYLH